MIGIGFRRCPKCKGYMTPYLITSGRTYYKCPSCGYDSANEVCTYTNKTDFDVKNCTSTNKTECKECKPDE